MTYIEAMALFGVQLDLFPGFAMPAGQPCTKRKRRCFTRTRPLVIARPVQLLIILIDRVTPPPVSQADDSEVEDDPFVTAPVVHMWVSAAGCKAPKTTAPRSIFDMGSTQIVMRSFRGSEEPRSAREATHIEIARVDGTVRVTRVHHTETEDWQEKERARRARQTPPKPKKQVFTMKNSRVWEKESA